MYATSPVPSLFCMINVQLKLGLEWLLERYYKIKKITDTKSHGKSKDSKKPETVCSPQNLVATGRLLRVTCIA